MMWACLWLWWAIKARIPKFLGRGKRTGLTAFPWLVSDLATPPTFMAYVSSLPAQVRSLCWTFFHSWNMTGPFLICKQWSYKQSFHPQILCLGSLESTVIYFQQDVLLTKCCFVWQYLVNHYSLVQLWKKNLALCYLETVQNSEKRRIKEMPFSHC